MDSPLYLVRHGEIEAPDSIRFADGDRPLSEAGASKILNLANELKQHAVRPVLILHSPLLRAVQTASIISEALKTKPQSWDLLAGDLPPDRWGKELSPYFSNGSASDSHGVMLVGHEPSLAGLIAAVTNISPYALEFSRGTFVELGISSLLPTISGRVRAVISPKWADLNGPTLPSAERD